MMGARESAQRLSALAAEWNNRLKSTSFCSISKLADSPEPFAVTPAHTHTTSQLSQWTLQPIDSNSTVKSKGLTHIVAVNVPINCHLSSEAKVEALSNEAYNGNKCRKQVNVKEALQLAYGKVFKFVWFTLFISFWVGQLKLEVLVLFPSIYQAHRNHSSNSEWHINRLISKRKHLLAQFTHAKSKGSLCLNDGLTGTISKSINSAELCPSGVMYIWSSP